MPKRPPKDWFDRCVRRVKKNSPDVDDSNAVCGDLWHNKMSPSAKKKAMASEGKVVGFAESDLQEVIKERKMKDKKDGKPCPKLEDPMGTGTVLKAVADHWNAVHRETQKGMISRDQYWGGLVKAVKEHSLITDVDLISAGIPVGVALDVLSEQDEETTGDGAYKTLHLKRESGAEESLPVDEAAEKIAPHTKNFGSPMEALINGNPDSVLKVMRYVFGDDVVEWWIPADAQEALSRPVMALALGEAYHFAKFGKKSQIYRMVDDELVVRDEAAEKVNDAFDKRSTEYLLNLFPNANPGYVKVLVNEVKTVLNLKSKEEMDRLFPNINPIYLTNIKESQKQALADAFGGGGVLAYFNQQLHNDEDEDEEKDEK